MSRAVHGVGQFEGDGFDSGSGDFSGGDFFGGSFDTFSGDAGVIDTAVFDPTTDIASAGPDTGFFGSEFDSFNDPEAMAWLDGDTSSSSGIPVTHEWQNYGLDDNSSNGGGLGFLSGILGDLFKGGAKIGTDAANRAITGKPATSPTVGTPASGSPAGVVAGAVASSGNRAAAVNSLAFPLILLGVAIFVMKD